MSKQPQVDMEASQKETIKKSPVGQLLISDLRCADCGTPVLKDWKSCINCGGTKAVKAATPPKVEAPAAETQKKK